MVTQLEKVGFADRYKLDDCNYTLIGAFAGENCDILVTGTPKTNTVYSVMASSIHIYSSWSTVKNRYLELKKAFTSKYGSPILEHSNFEYPFSEGNGNEMMAIMLDKCTYNCTFEIKGKGLIILNIVKARSGAEAKIIIIYLDDINSKLNEQENNTNIMNDI